MINEELLFFVIVCKHYKKRRDADKQPENDEQRESAQPLSTRNDHHHLDCLNSDTSSGHAKL